MDRRKLDVLIQQTLHDRAESVSMTESEKSRIYQAIADCSKEDCRMKINGKQKLVAAVAAMCLLGSMVAFGAGKIVGYSSGHNSNEPEFAAYADMKQVEAKVGFPVKAPERFENGYQFQKGFVINTNAHDEGGQVVDTFPEVSIHYENGEKTATLTVQKVRSEWEKSMTGNPVDIAYGDVIMTYREDHYKFVPPDYQLTEEDQKAEESGDLYISYGSSEVEYKDFHFLTWQEEAVSYSLMTYGDDALGQDEMVQMAHQVIDSPKL